jgi:type I restriction enzyme S subunit
VQRGDVNGRPIGATLYAPELRLYLLGLKANPAAEKNLGAYVDINPQLPESELESDSSVSFLPMDAVSDGATGEFTLAERQLSEVSKGYTPFINGDILWAKITPCMQNGKSCIATGLKHGVGFGSTEFHVIRNRSKDVSTEFIWEFLNQETLRHVSVYSFTGSAGHQRVPDWFLADLPLPKFGEKKQALLVQTMKEARAKRRSKLDEAEDLLAGLDGFLLNAIGLTLPPKDNRIVYSVKQKDLIFVGRIDPGYHHPRYTKLLEEFAASPVAKLSLGMLSPDIVGGATPTKGNKELYAEEGVKFLRILNVKANEFDLSDLNYITKDVHEGELKRSQLQQNDILLTITGRVGNAAVVTPNLLPANINQHIARLRLSDGRVSPEYLATYLNSSVGLALSNRGVTGGTRVALDYGTIRNIQIPAPKPKVQEQIVIEAHRRRDGAQRLRAEAEAGWLAAKCWFEEQILTSAKP